MRYKVTVYFADFIYSEFIFKKFSDASDFARLAIKGWTRREIEKEDFYYNHAKVRIEALEENVEDIVADDSAESDS